MSTMDPGADPTSSEKYTVYLPFQLARNQSVEGNESADIVAESRRLTLQAGGFRATIRFGPFPTEEAAQAGFLSLRRALLVVAAEKRLGLRVDDETEVVVLLDEPLEVAESSPVYELWQSRGWTHVDGYVDGNKPAILPEHRRILITSTGAPTIMSSIQASDFLQWVVESGALAEGYVLPPKVDLALEVYGSVGFEEEPHSKFLRMVTILEILAPKRKCDEPILSIVLGLQEIVVDRHRSAENGSEEARLLEQLKSRLGSLKRISIGEGVRTFVQYLAPTLSAHGEVQDQVDRIDEYYGLRSDLLHDGIADDETLADGVRWLSAYLPDALRAIVSGAVEVPS